EGDGGAGDGHRDAGGVEDPREPPDPGTAPVLVVRLRAGIPLRRVGAGPGGVAPAAVAVVAPQHGVLRAPLLDAAQGGDDAGAVRPGEARRRAPVADEVAGPDGVRDVHGATLFARVTPAQSRSTIEVAARRTRESGEEGVLYGRRQAVGGGGRWRDVARL